MLESLNDVPKSHHLRGRENMWKGRQGNKSNMSKPVVEHYQLKHELKAMPISLTNKDTEIACLKAQLMKSTIRGTRSKRTGIPE
ncbi:hypothetical protein KY285_007932 [Solanum tuberosum]|nr:hypothetical protein KY285_007932 [Solanum tuberosum]